ncbi:MAG: NAD(P)-binding domain-containing protein [Bryobacteraceae bacterium]|nr:NAD(P)-binding domain-containing protein [Bryobacteraceae bacterium]
MSTKVAIIGAGGKMGFRAAQKIGSQSGFIVLMCESHPGRAAELAANGFPVAALPDALAEADYVFLAVPDALIGAISCQAEPLMKPGAMLIMLDAAAAYVDELPVTSRIGMMITHPCHPAFFVDRPTPEERADYFGGVARQDIIVCLIQGSEESFWQGVEVCRAVFGPTDKAHRVTVEQFAFLEPAMSELIVASAARWMRDSLDAAIAAGVPREAAEAFMAGHAQIAIAICFGAEKAPFSDAAKLAIDWGTRELINPDWRRVFQRPVLQAAIREMIHPPTAPEI